MSAFPDSMMPEVPARPDVDALRAEADDLMHIAEFHPGNYWREIERSASTLRSIASWIDTQSAQVDKPNMKELAALWLYDASTLNGFRTLGALAEQTTLRRCADDLNALLTALPAVNPTLKDA